MLEATVEINNRSGSICALPPRWPKPSRTFQSKVTIVGKDGQADARSVTNLMMLGAAIGSRLKVSAEGPDARAALDAIERLFEDRFGED